MSEQRAVDILRTFTKNRTQVEINDITWTLITEDNPSNPQASYRMHVMAHVAGISTNHPQEAVHTPHTHLTIGLFRISGNQVYNKETLLRKIKSTMPLNFAAELQMMEEEPKRTRSRNEDHWCLPLHIHRNVSRDYDPLHPKTELATWIDSIYTKIAEDIQVHNRTYAYIGMEGGRKQNHPQRHISIYEQIGADMESRDELTQEHQTSALQQKSSTERKWGKN